MAFELLYYKPIPTQKCYYASRKVAWKPFLFHAQGGMMGQKEMWFHKPDFNFMKLTTKCNNWEELAAWYSLAPSSKL